jgi:hypothetical protein
MEAMPFELFSVDASGIYKWVHTDARGPGS